MARYPSKYHLQFGIQNMGTVSLIERRDLGIDDLHHFLEVGLTESDCVFAQITTEHVDPATLAMARSMPSYKSGDRCHRCGGRAFSVGRIVAECSKCGGVVPLADSR